MEETEMDLLGWNPNTSITSKSPSDVPLDITFRHITYRVGKGDYAKETLHKISGTFKSGKLTAILGPSGAGKTTLMNILAGRTSKSEGRIEVNGAKRLLNSFRKQSAYITQKDHLLENLTVDEYMKSAAHLKLGYKVSESEKEATIELILKTLGLPHTRETRVTNLSGGECKRLSIGLELIGNPAVLFLDEPTSGLDSLSSLQCVALLREIARSGRTVVTTIHQPSSRILDYFDHLYIVTNGYCMYQGDVESLIPFFKTVDLICPSYHNPADFAMDVACGEYGNFEKTLVAGVENGRLIFPETSSSTLPTPSLSHDTGFYDDEEENHFINGREKKKTKNSKNRQSYACPFQSQIAVLLVRSWRTTYRDKILTLIRLITHILVALFAGAMYFSTGDEAAVAIFTTTLLYFSQVFILFTSVSPTLVTFPMERQVLLREHLNHWYSLKAYYLAKTLVDIPFQFIFPTFFVTIVYLMTSQPMSFQRYSMFLAITICTSLVGQGIGLFLGAAFGIKVAVFLGLTGCIPMVLFSGFPITFDAIPISMKWISFISFMRYGFEGSMVSIFGYGRPPLNCSLPYCMYRNPQDLLENFQMAESSFYFNVLGMAVFFSVVRFLTYFVLRFKLKSMMS